MTFTEARLLAALNRPGPSAAKRAEAIRERMPIWTACANAAGIIDARDFALFFGQVAIESDGFATAVEYWGPTAQQARYEGRRDLGNIQAGDGVRYHGRGIFQLTGRTNYRRFGQILGIDLERKPELAMQPETSLRVAFAYWSERAINAAADADDVERVTRLINGGRNGLAERKRYLQKAKGIWS